MKQLYLWTPDSISDSWATCRAKMSSMASRMAILWWSWLKSTDTTMKSPQAGWEGGGEKSGNSSSELTILYPIKMWLSTDWTKSLMDAWVSPLPMHALSYPLWNILAHPSTGPSFKVHWWKPTRASRWIVASSAASMQCSICFRKVRSASISHAKWAHTHLLILHT